MLIIAGQPKAGTTSLFDWLAVHPDICPSQLKETRFFLDSRYPLQRPCSFDTDGWAEYSELFPGSAGKVWLDATPDAMYSKTILDAAAVVPNGRVVVILRDPVARLVSAFLFFKQRALLPSKLGFDDWILQQGENTLSPDTPVQWRALDHCRVEKYLSPLRGAWGDRLLELEFTELVQSPSVLVSRVLRHVGVSDHHGVESNHKVSNKTKSVRWPRVNALFHSTRRYAASALRRYPVAKRLMKPLSRQAMAMLETERTPPKPQITPRIESYIRTFSGVTGSSR